ncbi:MAG: hypothetical protein A2041_05570 [Bacteroidetes bacterium GWA2_31_9b]|nr:MAG: hypothetical protein A2041_05570 [Bacteroidetes bacterium GWA2_31_9b]
MNNDKDNTFGNEYTPDKMKFLNFIYLNSKLFDAFSLSFLGILSGNQKEEGSNTVYGLGTFGPYLKYKSQKFYAQVNAFYQTGTNIESQEVSAYLLNAKATFQATSKINIGAGFDLISGNYNSDSIKDHSFDLLYGTRHGFNGEMDLFSNLLKSTLDAGLIDFYASFGIKLNPKNSILLTYHNFSLHKIAYNNTDEKINKKPLGNELDLNYKYKSELPLECTVGICVYKSTESMKTIQSIPNSDNTFNYYSYIMLTFTPELFSSK